MAHYVVEVKRIQARHRKEIKEAKSLYKEKVKKKKKKQFSNGNLKEAWMGIKTLTAQNANAGKDCFASRDLGTLPQEFNESYTRCDKLDLSSELSQVKTDLGKFVSDGVVLEETEEESVRAVFKRVTGRKVSGADGLSWGILKTCSE